MTHKAVNLIFIMSLDFYFFSNGESVVTHFASQMVLVHMKGDDGHLDRGELSVKLFRAE